MEVFLKANQYFFRHQRQASVAISCLLRRIQIKNILLITTVIVLYAGLSLSPAYAQWQPKNYLMKTDPAHAKPRYWEDPNVWVYTPEFAKRFGMPEKWATNDLKGAQAITYRIVFDRHKTCGWFSDKSSCTYNYECVMDIYTGHDAGLPWEPGSPPMGVRAMKNGKSTRFLSPQKRSDNADWDPVKNKYDRKKDILGIANTGVLAGKPVKKGKTYSYRSSGELMMLEYVRNVFPNLDYFSTIRSCLLYEHPENVRIRFSRDKDAWKLDDEVTTAYEIKLPYSFMLRMAEYMKDRYEGKNLWAAVKKRMRNEKEGK